jgi:hypothetical protein
VSLEQNETMTLDQAQQAPAVGTEAAAPAIAAGADDDPMPEPPDPVDPNACCSSGCEWCVLDLHAQDEARYRSALAAWQQRRGQGQHSDTN